MLDCRLLLQTLRSPLLTTTLCCLCWFHLAQANEFATAFEVYAQQAALLPAPAINRNAQPIINGSVAEAGKQPWMAALLHSSSAASSYQRAQFCGGVLIASQWVLTAAHCVDDVAADGIKVALGVNNLTQDKGQLHDVAAIHLHSNFTRIFYGKDIALIQLATPSTQTPLAIATPEEDTQLIGSKLSVYGWGKTNGKDTLDCEITTSSDITNASDFHCLSYTYSTLNKPANLMQTSLRYPSNAECYKVLVDVNKARGINNASAPANDEVVPDGMCLTDAEGSTGICFGDSGSPAVGHVGTKAVLVGLVSFGFSSSCQSLITLEFLTRVSRYADFISEAKRRKPALGLDQLCPKAEKPTLTYNAAQSSGATTLTITWKKTDNATGYRLFYKFLPRSNAQYNLLELPASQTELTVALPAKTNAIVALQNHYPACDSKISAGVEVLVP